MNKEEARLAKRVEDVQELLDEERCRKKPNPNELMEKDTPLQMSKFDFWCESCQEDFSAPCYKTKHRIYGDTIAVWRTSCPICEVACIRHITHMDEDQYYNRSAKIRVQRNQYAFEILQPGEYGFRMKYGEPYEAFERKMREREMDIITAELKEGLKGQSLKVKEQLRRLRR